MNVGRRGRGHANRAVGAEKPPTGQKRGEAKRAVSPALCPGRHLGTDSRGCLAGSTPAPTFLADLVAAYITMRRNGLTRSLALKEMAPRVGLTPQTLWRLIKEEAGE